MCIERCNELRIWWTGYPSRMTCRMKPRSFPHQEELSSKAEEFHKYITNNAKLIPNYAERRRYGERVATGFVESTVNQVVSKRMVKRQQMRWSERGAHELLQVRTRVLNDDLLEAFGRWYPGMTVGSGRTEEKKAA